MATPGKRGAVGSTASTREPCRRIKTVVHSLVVGAPCGPNRQLPPRHRVTRVLSIAQAIMHRTLVVLRVGKLIRIHQNTNVCILSGSNDRGASDPSTGIYGSTNPFRLLRTQRLLRDGVTRFTTLRTAHRSVIGVHRTLRLRRHRLTSDTPNDDRDNSVRFRLTVTRTARGDVLIRLFHRS